MILKPWWWDQSFKACFQLGSLLKVLISCLCNLQFFKIIVNKNLKKAQEVGNIFKNQFFQFGTFYFVMDFFFFFQLKSFWWSWKLIMGRVLQGIFRAGVIAEGSHHCKLLTPYEQDVNLHNQWVRLCRMKLITLYCHLKWYCKIKTNILCIYPILYNSSRNLCLSTKCFLLFFHFIIIDIFV